MAAGMVPEQSIRVYILIHRQQTEPLGLTGTKPAPLPPPKATVPSPFQIRINRANMRAYGVIFIQATTNSLRTSTSY